MVWESRHKLNGGFRPGKKMEMSQSLDYTDSDVSSYIYILHSGKNTNIMAPTLLVKKNYYEKMLLPTKKAFMKTVG